MSVQDFYWTGRNWDVPTVPYQGDLHTDESQGHMPQAGGSTKNRDYYLLAAHLSPLNT